MGKLIDFLFIFGALYSGLNTSFNRLSLNLKVRGGFPFCRGCEYCYLLSVSLSLSESNLLVGGIVVAALRSVSRN